MYDESQNVRRAEFGRIRRNQLNMMLIRQKKGWRLYSEGKPQVIAGRKATDPDEVSGDWTASSGWLGCRRFNDK